MTKQEKEQIKKMRLEGYGYGKIAQVLNIPKSTISSFCITLMSQPSLCLDCNKRLKQATGHRQKKYCSDKCRMNYWKSHKDEIKRSLDYSVECSHCHRVFFTYQSLNRKYCSRDCFLKNKSECRGNG